MRAAGAGSGLAVALLPLGVVGGAHHVGAVGVDVGERGAGVARVGILHRPQQVPGGDLALRRRGLGGAVLLSRQAPRALI
jgi:hypothetical protein